MLNLWPAVGAPREPLASASSCRPGVAEDQPCGPASRGDPGPDAAEPGSLPPGPPLSRPGSAARPQRPMGQR